MEKLRELNPLHDKYGYLSLVVFGAVVLAIGLLVRSDLFLSIVGFVLEILGWLGILGGAAIVAAGVAAFGHERGWWNRIIEANGQSGAKLPLIRGLSGSALFLLVILFFFLPWMSISCFGEELVTVSGADIMGITQVDDIPSDVADGDYGIGDALTSEAALLYVAALLAIVGRRALLPARNSGQLHKGGHSRCGHRVHPGISVSDAPIARVGDGGRYRRARGRGHRGELEIRLLAVSSGVHRGDRGAVRSSAGRGAFARWLKRLPERLPTPSLQALSMKGR